MEFEYKEEYSLLTRICLNVTDACNFACKYCFVEQNPHFITLQTAKDAVDFIAENLRKKEQISGKKEKGSIAFFGGEPTLMWDEIIVPTVLYSRKEKNYNISFSITTNGSLLTPERIEFLKNYNISMLLSMDGDRFTQNFNRPSRNKEIDSFEAVLKNIPYILTAFPDVTYRATIYAPTVEHTFENYIFASSLGFKNIYFLPDSRHPWTEEQKQELKRQIDKIYNFIYICFQNGQKPINFRLINRAFEHILKHDVAVYRNKPVNLEFSRDVRRCGLGTAMGSIGYDGNIYGCQEQDSKNINSFFHIGNIYNGGINRDKHELLLRTYAEPKKQMCINENLCENCRLRNICYDFCCPSTSYDMFEDFFIDSEIHCLWSRWLFDDAIVIMKKLVEENNLTFKEYLEKDCKYNKIFKEVKEVE